MIPTSLYCPEPVDTMYLPKEQSDDVVFAYLREDARRELRSRHPYLPQTALDRVLDRISSASEILEEVMPEMEASKARSNFFDPPAELRVHIYEMVLLPDERSKGYYPLRDTLSVPGILIASKQIRAQALPIYYSNTFSVDCERESTREYGGDYAIFSCFEDACVEDCEGESADGKCEEHDCRKSPCVNEELERCLGAQRRLRISRVKELVARVRDTYTWHRYDRRLRYLLQGPQERSLLVENPGYTKQGAYKAIQLEGLGVPLEHFKLYFEGFFEDQRAAGWCELLDDGTARQLEPETDSESSEEDDDEKDDDKEANDDNETDSNEAESDDIDHDDDGSDDEAP